jgi:hypothetical protein
VPLFLHFSRFLDEVSEVFTVLRTEQPGEHNLLRCNMLITRLLRILLIFEARDLLGMGSLGDGKTLIEDGENP